MKCKKSMINNDSSRILINVLKRMMLMTLLTVPALGWVHAGQVRCAMLFSLEEAPRFKTTLSDKIKSIFLGRKVEEVFDKYLSRKHAEVILVSQTSKKHTLHLAMVLRRGENGDYIVRVPGGPAENEISVPESSILVPSKFMGVVTLPHLITDARDGKDYLFQGFYRDGTVVVGHPWVPYLELNLNDIVFK